MPRPGRFTPQKEPVPIVGTSCVWWAPGPVWTGGGKPRPPHWFDPWTVQPLASRYTDWAIPAHNKKSTLHVLILLKSGSLNLLEPSGPVQACTGTALPSTFLPVRIMITRPEEPYRLWCIVVCGRVGPGPLGAVASKAIKQTDLYAWYYQNQRKLVLRNVLLIAHSCAEGVSATPASQATERQCSP